MATPASRHPVDIEEVRWSLAPMHDPVSGPSRFWDATLIE